MTTFTTYDGIYPGGFLIGGAVGRSVQGIGAALDIRDRITAGLMQAGNMHNHAHQDKNKDQIDDDDLLLLLTTEE